MRLRGRSKLNETRHKRWTRKLRKENINNPKYKKKYDSAVEFFNTFTPARGSASSTTINHLYWHYLLTIEWGKCSKFSGRGWRKIEKVRRKTNDSESRYY